MYYYTFLNENPLQRYTFFDICKRPRIFSLTFLLLVLWTRGVGGDHLSRVVGAPSPYFSAAPYSPLASGPLSISPAFYAGIAKRAAPPALGSMRVSAMRGV